LSRGITGSTLLVGIRLILCATVLVVDLGILQFKSLLAELLTKVIHAGVQCGTSFRMCGSKAKARLLPVNIQLDTNWTQLLGVYPYACLPEWTPQHYRQTFKQLVSKFGFPETGVNWLQVHWFDRCRRG
jgi:hypothetical protein